ncbi:MAG: SMC family ATPase [Caldiserica bacterium]|jgi:exonuclease SbcC|nr:SMC family ATPase [Caldisericota bacterium]MDH7561778.1 SMC family ATPase [Caldisericota bacterium]
MILIRKLQVHNFKQLENLSLWFPEKGSFLIEGANEAGKSSLFEAIFFGIFGRPLAGSLPDLVNFQENVKKATVELEITAEGEILHIFREIPKQGNQSAYLIVKTEDGKELDRISKVKVVNDRIERALKFDSQAFLNSCFVEQKKLGKLEEATSQERRNALSKLINLDFMLELEEKFKVSMEDKNRLNSLKEREELARIREELAPLEDRLKKVERQLKLLSLKGNLENLKRNKAEIDEWREKIASLESKKVQLREKIETLEKLNSLATEIRIFLSSRQNLTNLQKQMEAVEGELEELKKKGDSIPQLEGRISQLRTLKRNWDRIQDLENKKRETEQKLDAVAGEIDKKLKKREELERIKGEKEALNAQRKGLEEKGIELRNRAKKELALAIVFLLLAVSISLPSIFGLLPIYLLSFLTLLIPAIFFSLKSKKRKERANSIQREIQSFLEQEQKLAGKMEIFQTPEFDLKFGGFEEELNFLRERKARIEKALNSALEKVQKEGSLLGARTRDEVVGEINRLEGKIEDLKKEVARIEDRTNYLRNLSQSFQKQSLEEEKHGKILQNLDPGIYLEEDSLRGKLAELQRNLQETKARELKAELSGLENDVGALSGRVEIKERENQKILSELKETCSILELPFEKIMNGEDIPELEALPPVEEKVIKGERDYLFAERESMRKKEAELSEKLGLKEIALDFSSARKEREDFEHQLRVREIAKQILSVTREAIYNQVKPQTEYHMSLIVPLLTSNRYQEVQLTDEYKIRVWDERARGYREKEIFSGGTQDQFSLALRLAFAMATLPQERGSSPGFIFLDEPFSSSDIERTKALVELLTRGIIHEVFPQVFVISHSTVVDPEEFDYYLYLENGRVTKNTIEEIHKYPQEEHGLFQ